MQAGWGQAHQVAELQEPGRSLCGIEQAEEETEKDFCNQSLMVDATLS